MIESSVQEELSKISRNIIIAIIWISIPLWSINCRQEGIEEEIRLQNKLLIELNQ